VRFVTPIYHPNIDSSGRICLSILKEGVPNGWSVALGLQTTLLSIQQLFACPGTEDPLVIEICEEYKTDYALFARKAKAHAQQHAIQAETSAPMNSNNSNSANSVNSNEKKNVPSTNANSDAILASRLEMESKPEPDDRKVLDNEDEIANAKDSEMMVDNGLFVEEIEEEKRSLNNNSNSTLCYTNTTNNNSSNNLNAKSPTNRLPFKSTTLPLPARTPSELENDRPKKRFKLGVRKTENEAATG
jgi:hypothetical protein